MSHTRPELIVFPTAPEQTAAARPPDYALRPTVRGQFIFIGPEKYWVKGVTYGTFRPNAGGEPFPPRETVQRDFTAMAARGINTVIRADGTRASLRGRDEARVAPGDAIEIETPGGGGYGKE